MVNMSLNDEIKKNALFHFNIKFYAHIQPVFWRRTDSTTKQMVL